MKNRVKKYKYYGKMTADRRRKRKELNSLIRRYNLIGMALGAVLFIPGFLLKLPTSLLYISFFLFGGYIVWCLVMFRRKAIEMFGPNYKCDYDNHHYNEMSTFLWGANHEILLAHTVQEPIFVDPRANAIANINMAINKD